VHDDIDAISSCQLPRPLRRLLERRMPRKSPCAPFTLYLPTPQRMRSDMDFFLEHRVLSLSGELAQVVQHRAEQSPRD
jgi:hypothetical protein